MTTKIQRVTARYRYSVILLRELVVSDFKLRYQNSVLGYLWSLLRPLALFAILYVVFVKILKAGGDLPHFGVYLLVGIVVWSYFSEVTGNSISAMVDKGDLLRKVNFPRYIIIVATSLSSLINLLFNFVIVAIFMFADKTDPSRVAVLLPLLFVQLFVFTLAVSFLLSALYVRYRDIRFIWDVVMQGAFFATPIMYDYALVSTTSATLAKILIVSPLTQIMQDMRFMLITPQSQTVASVFNGMLIAYVMPFGLTVLLAVSAGLYFRKRSAYFAEEV